MRAIMTLGVFFCLVLSSADAADVPVILVHGFGPKFSWDMGRYKGFLEGDGYDYRNIHSLYYPQKSSPANLQKEAQQDLADILSQYPAGTQFDMITHSFGGFVGWYTVMPSKFAVQLRKYISLAGMARGVDSLPLCDRFDCGDTLPRLIPFMNPFVKGFHDANAAAMAAVDKCSLYSWQDQIINDPADTGALTGGKNVEVKNVAHNDFIRDYDLYQLMRTNCYGAKPPAPGFRHTWRVR